MYSIAAHLHPHGRTDFLHHLDEVHGLTRVPLGYYYNPVLQWHLQSAPKLMERLTHNTWITTDLKLYYTLIHVPLKLQNQKQHAIFNAMFSHFYKVNAVHTQPLTVPESACKTTK